MLATVRDTVHRRPADAGVTGPDQEVDPLEWGARRGGVIRALTHAVCLEGLIGPVKQIDILNRELCVRDPLELTRVIVLTGVVPRQAHHAYQRIARIHIHQRCVKCLTVGGHVPARDRPVAASTGGGWAILKYRLENSEPGPGILNAIEEKDRLSGVGGRSVWNNPGGRKRVDRSTRSTIPPRVDDPAAAESRNRAGGLTLHGRSGASGDEGLPLGYRGSHDHRWEVGHRVRGDIELAQPSLFMPQSIAWLDMMNQRFGAMSARSQYCLFCHDEPSLFVDVDRLSGAHTVNHSGRTRPSRRDDQLALASQAH